MVDIEHKLFDTLRTVIIGSFSTASVSGEYVPAPASFPHVTIEQIDCTTYSPAKIVGEAEKFADVSYDINVYSNKTSGRKTEAKAIISVIDDTMTQLGFERSMLSPTPNVADASIYRITARYDAVVGKTSDATETIFTIYQGG